MKIIYNNFNFLIIFYIEFCINVSYGYYGEFFWPQLTFNYNYAQRRNIENSMNKTVEPCENFYEYACGNYIYDNNHGYYEEITQYLNYKFNNKLLEVIRRPKGLFENFSIKLKKYLRRYRQTLEEKMQNYYLACSSERRGNFWKYLKELKINWPLLPQKAYIKSGLIAKELKSNDFWQVLGLLHSYNCKNLIWNFQIQKNLDGFIEMAVKPSSFETTKTLPEDDFVMGFFQHLDVDNTPAVVHELKLTQKNWLEITKNLTQSEEEPKEMSYPELIAEYPYFSVYLQSLMGEQVNELTKIILVDPEFFKYLVDIEWSGQDLEQQLTFLMINFFYYLALDGTTGHTPLACIKDMREKFDLAANYMFYQHVEPYEKKSYKQAIKELENKILDTFDLYFKEATLNFTSLEVKELKNKFSNITFNLGNLPDPLVYKEIEQFYDLLPQMDNENYFKNHLLLLKQRFLNTFQTSTTTTNLNIFLSDDMKPILTSSPFYVIEQNMIVIPLANLQYPMFHYDFTPLYQMSLMGFILSHEVAHVFDNSSLISPEFTKCLEHQQPTDDMDERIADIMAERVMYRAYKTYYADDSDNMWPRYFYLNMAQFFCHKGGLKFLNHDSDDVRLQQIVMNSPEFAETFNCSLDKPMNPREKCRLF